MSQYKYLKVEVTRTESTEVYIKVPEDFNPRHLPNEIVRKATVKTTTDDDWDKWGWEDSVEWQGIKEVPASEATQFKVYNLEEGK